MTQHVYRGITAIMMRKNSIIHVRVSSSTMSSYWRLSDVEETGRELGRGSYAAVIEVNYKGLKCAGKKIHRVLYEDGEGDLIQRFEEECQLLSQLRHPHIVQFLGVYFEEHTNVPVLVMEFLPTTLAQTLDRYGRLPEEINYSILRDVSLGLRYLHERPRPIIHRDLSANNVLLSDNMTAKISDLGVARMLHLTPLEMSRMTQQPGTLSYMPPEALAPNPRYDTTIDIFSFGVLIVHVLSGEWPIPVEAVQVNPHNPKDLSPLSESERRGKYLDAIRGDSPLMELIVRCLDNSALHRPTTVEVCDQVCQVASQHPHTFENIIELLQQVATTPMARETPRNLCLDDHDYIQIIDDTESVSTPKEQTPSSLTANTEARLRATIRNLEQAYRVEKQSRATKALEIEQLTFQITDLQEQRAQLNRNVLSIQRTGRMQLRAQQEEHEALLQMSREQCQADLRAERKELLTQMDTEKQKHKIELDHQRALLEAQQRQQIEAERKNLQPWLDAQKQKHTAELQCEQRTHQAQLQTKEAEKAVLLMELEESRSNVSRRDAAIETLREQLGRMQKIIKPSNEASPFTPGSSLVWRKCSEPPNSMHRAKAIVIDNKVYIGGGIAEGSCSNRSIMQYSPIRDEWEQLLLAPVQSFGMGCLRGKLVLVGGKDGSYGQITANVHVLEEDKWVTPIPSMQTARANVAVLSYKESAIVACGGEGVTERTLASVEFYRSDDSQWHATTSLPFPTRWMSSVTIGERCFLVGGQKDSTLRSAVHSVITTSLPQLINSDPSCSTAQWKVLHDAPHYHSAVATIGGCLLLIGGQSEMLGMVLHKSVRAYCPATSSWVEVGEIPSKSSECAAVLLPSNELLVIGLSDEEVDVSGHSGEYEAFCWRGAVKF